MRENVGAVVAAVAAALAAACGGDGATGPVPCDVYTGGIVSGPLPGTYDLVSLCQGQKPNLVPPAATGTVTITEVTSTEGQFTASFAIQGQPTTLDGSYTTDGSAITIILSGELARIDGTFRLRNDTLALSGTVAGAKLALVGTRTTP